MRSKRLAQRLALVSGIALLAACAQSPSWFREAGGRFDGGDQGFATSRNAGIQSGAVSYVAALENRFADEVNSTVNFAFNSATLDENARRILREQAAWIRRFPEVRFKVFGHTDAVGPDAYNKRLGMRRARAVVAYLISQGVDRSRLEAVVSFGESQPVVVTQGREPRNRRTVTEVTGFVESHPLILNGKYAEVLAREYVGSATAPPGQGDVTGAFTSDG